MSGTGTGAHAFDGDRSRTGDADPSSADQHSIGRPPVTHPPAAQPQGGRSPGAHRFDPDATILLPQVTVTAAETTMELPVVIDFTSSTEAAAPASPPVPGIRPGGVPAPATAAGRETIGGEAADSGAGVARHGAIMAAGSVVSRLTGFIRTVVIGAAIGAALVSDDYNLANTLPNMVYELLLGGVLASVVIPLLVRAKNRDADAGLAYSQRLLTLATVFLGGATLLAVAAAPLLTAMFADSGTSAADKNLVTVLGYLLLPEIFFYGVAALFAAVLNTRGHFAAPMWTPILNNVVVIVTALVFMILPTAGSDLTAASVTTAQILVLGVGTTLGIVVQAAGLWPALRRVGWRWRWRWDFRQLALRELARVGGWMLGYVLVSQLGVLVILRLAYTAGKQGTLDRVVPGPAIYNNAYLIFMMIHGIVAVSIITALMPRMAAAAASGRHGDLATQLSLGTRLSAVILMPATAAYLVLGRPIGVSLFSVGQYSHDQAVATGWVIAVAGLGLVPFAISQLQTFVFWAMPDTRTPALVNLPVVALRVGADLVLYVLLPAYWVDAGLMAGNTISFMLATVLGYALLRRRIGRLGLAQIGSTLGRLAAATVIGGLASWLVLVGLTAATGAGKIASIVQLVTAGLVLVLVYVAAAFVLRVREVRELTGMVRGRLGR
jgi:putative peptidoglycan lipid II flippase